MPWSNGGRRSGGGPPRDLEDLLKRSQDKIKQAMPGGSGLPGSFLFLVAVVTIAVAAFYAFTFRVDPDELGIVMRFGKPVRSEPPGLHFRQPYPIEEVRLPKVTRQNIIEVGMRSSEGSGGVLRVVDPPTQVIDAFRDVQAARADQERLQNEAGSYANRVVPEARGEAERILQSARAYREQTVAEATGQAARFLKVFEEYKKAPEVTRKRMYLETMERVLGGADKIILDSKGGQVVVPLLPLDQVQRRKEEGK